MSGQGVNAPGCGHRLKLRLMGQAMASTHKKVIVRKIDRDTIQGYVASSEFLADGKMELLNTAGNVVLIDLAQIKSVYFVRDFADSSSLLRKTFTSRPRVEGLWVRLRFRDAEMFEALMPNDLTQLRAEGFFLNPPDMRGNVQRIFVPRSALSELTVLAVIGPSVKRRRPAETAAETPLLFTELPAE
jgi:Family of unknown function (DUF6982)